LSKRPEPRGACWTASGPLLQPTALASLPWERRPGIGAEQWPRTAEWLWSTWRQWRSERSWHRRALRLRHGVPVPSPSRPRVTDEFFLLVASHRGDHFCAGMTGGSNRGQAYGIRPSLDQHHGSAEQIRRPWRIDRHRARGLFPRHSLVRPYRRPRRDSCIA